MSETPTTRGLTPVVGIVLLVAITLLLASTVAAFAFGIEDESQAPNVPTTAFDVEYDSNAGDDALRIVHRSGQRVELSTLEVVVEGAACTGGGADPNGRHPASALSTLGPSGELSAGEMIRIDGSVLSCSGGSLDLSGATVRVIWSPDAGTSAVLRAWHGPG